MLVLSGHPCTLLLHVGKQWLDERGVLSEEPQAPSMLAGHEIRSARYPLSIYAGHDLPSLWRSLWQTRPWAILLLLGICFGFALLIWWLLGRPRSPESSWPVPCATGSSYPICNRWWRREWSGDGRRGVDALAAPDGRADPPRSLHSRAEASGLIVPMTTLLMEEVARELSMARELVPHGFHISFNISAVHCRDMTLLAGCRRFLDHFAPGQVVLVLELTERELLVADPKTLALFRRLDEMGVRLAIDDFGTGHSSLHYLQQFHVDYLKIDKSFIGRIGTESSPST